MSREIELLEEVVKYYEGKPPYNFWWMNPYDRDNEAFDAWQKIYGQIKSLLKEYQIKD